MNKDDLLKRLYTAQKLIQEDRRFNEGIVILKEVLSHIPTDYQYHTIEGDTEYIEFWDQEEFLEYVEYVKKTNSQLKVNWMGNVFPKSCYFISVAFLEINDINSAEKYLNIGLSLEKDNPLLLNEMGMLNASKAETYNDLNYYKEAKKYYVQAFDARPYISNQLKARALRGVGFCEIELKNFDEAEKCFKDSMTYEHNSIALNELAYIQMAKKGIIAPTYTNLSGGPKFKEIKSNPKKEETSEHNKLKSFFNKFFKN